MKKKAPSPKTKRQIPTYPLKKVRLLIDEDKVVIRENALQSALADFGWKVDDILKALKKLQPRHFCKSEKSMVKNPEVTIDFYKADDIMGEDVYTHFYIDEGTLIINSFKERT
jgi:hypothetical protein